MRSCNRLFLNFSLLPCWRVWPRLLLAVAVAPLARMEAEIVSFGGTQTLNAPGGDDDLLVQTNAIVTLGGGGGIVLENSLSNESSSALTALTINSADASLRVLVVGATTLANSVGRGLSIGGSADFRPGILSDNGFSNVQLVKNGGPGELILDNPASSLFGQGTLLRVVSGTLSIEGGGGSLSPIASLSSALQIDGVLGKLRLGTPNAPGTTFNNSLLVNDSGTLEHTAVSGDTLGGSVTIAAGKTLNANITAGSLAVTGNLFGAGLVKNGGGELRFTNPATLDALVVNGGRLEFGGVFKVSFIPVIAAGATLALTSGAGMSLLPAVFTVPSGTLELVPGALGVGSTKISLTGGTLKLTVAGTLTNAVTASGSSGIAVGGVASQMAVLTLQPGTVLNKSAGGLTVSNLVFAALGTYTLGVTGGDFTVSASAGSGAVNLVKTGTGTLNLNGLQGCQTLETDSGVTNVNGSFTGGTATINAHATTNFGVSQTLAALNVGSAPVALVSASLVPEPASWGLLFGAAGLLLSRRRRS